MFCAWRAWLGPRKLLVEHIRMIVRWLLIATWASVVVSFSLRCRSLLLEALVVSLQIGSAPVGRATDWVELVTSLTSSLAWPVVVVILMFMFRKELKRFIEKLNKIKFPGFEGEVTQRLDEADDKANLAFIGGGDGVDSNVDAQSLKNIPPIANIMMEWIGIEKKIRRIAIKNDYTTRDRVSIGRSIERMVEGGLISRETGDVIRDLYSIRSRVSHGAEATEADAVRFIDLSKKIQKELDRIVDSEIGPSNQPAFNL